MYSILRFLRGGVLLSALALVDGTMVLTAQSVENVLLVVNDSSRDSRQIGEYYVRKRSLPENQICRIQIPPQPMIDRRVFTSEILRPVAECLSSRRLQDQVLYILTTKGIPLIVDGDDGPSGDLASVDSELTLTYRYLIQERLPTFGRVENRYFSLGLRAGRLVPFQRDSSDIYLVTRLTASTLIEALMLVDRAQAAPIAGAFYFDLPSARETAESRWVEAAVSRLEEDSQQPTVDRTADALTFGKPALGYCSWGAEDPSLSVDHLPTTWSPGGLAVAFDPISAAGFAQRQEEVPSFGPHLVAAGATGFGGFVANPSRDGYFRPNVLFPAYAAGYNLAESFYQANRYLGWRSVIVGDPLASPFAAKTAKLRRPSECSFDEDLRLPSCFAQRKLRYLVDIRKTQKDAARFYLRAEGFLAEGRVDDALTQADKALRLDPLVVHAHRLKGGILESRGQFQAAFEHYRKAQQGAYTPRLGVKMARLAFEHLDDPEQALGLLEKALAGRRSEMSLDEGLLLGRVEEALQHDQSAEAVYAALIRRSDPPAPEALEAMARLHFKRGEDIKLAGDLAEKALKAASQAKGSDASEGLSERLETLIAEIEAGHDEDTSPQEHVSAKAQPPARLDLPKILYRAATAYPKEARRRGIQGVVKLELLIDERGQLLRAKVLGGHPDLAKAAVKSVQRWSFSPRLVNGRPEIGYLPVRIKFEIKPVPEKQP